ncbi:hypothetical protein GGTG_06223 [Gaeumannomyces tritici R3-111a-1]|uniref:Uncharacterized protein n=1 Tax=Gaeumannomyces tritici (strain R3-111a-1) TaxID=644352 RepID=J3NY70_GAET3|nr:hypothetical protein GGTG_06223 [Gaeumannomyces tritici R3-111a-1]EJT76303.1 hypothetical protein GGTG_06223 [Gaeumannomyces tritici R3-111a-1]
MYKGIIGAAGEHLSRHVLSERLVMSGDAGSPRLGSSPLAALTEAGAWVYHSTLLGVMLGWTGAESPAYLLCPKAVESTFWLAEMLQQFFLAFVKFDVLLLDDEPSTRRRTPGNAGCSGELSSS